MMPTAFLPETGKFLHSVDESQKNAIFSFEEMKSFLQVRSEKHSRDTVFEEFQIYISSLRQGERITPFAVGNYLAQFLELAVYDRTIFIWKNGLWEIGEKEVKHELRNLLRANYTSTIESETLTWMKAEKPRHLPIEDQQNISFKNCLYDFREKKIKAHSPFYFTTRQIPHDLNPFAEAPVKFISFLEQSLFNERDSLEVQEKKLKTAFQIIGFCLMPVYFPQKVVMLIGEGANGKSVFLKVLKNILGKENVSAQSLQDLEKNRFAKASLFGKFANIYPDLPTRALNGSGIMRVATGGDYFQAERKFQEPFGFQNTAKLIFSANRPPDLGEDLEANWRRLFILEFPNSVPPHLQNDNLADELSAEIPGIILKSLESLDELLELRNFSWAKSTEEVRNEYLRASNPVAAFSMDMLEKVPGEWVSKDMLYSIYSDYCSEQGYDVLEKNVFFSKLSKFMPLREYRKGPQGNRERGIADLRIKGKFHSMTEAEKRDIEEDSE